MRGLKARLRYGFTLVGCSIIGISLTWSNALGNGTPDQLVHIPEPATAALFAAGIGALVVLQRYRRRK